MFEYYANNQWDFDNANLLYLRKVINDTERKKYKIDGEGVDIMQYFEDCIRAARIYILKESEESIPSARRHMKMLVNFINFNSISIQFFNFYIFYILFSVCIT